MLKRFFLNTLSSFVGTWIALVLFGIVAVLSIVGLVAKIGISSSTKSTVGKDSILTVELSGYIEEMDNPAEIDYVSLLFDGSIPKKQSLTTLVAAIEAAAENKNIKGLYLKCGSVSAYPATLNALRNAVIKFKESGKKVIAYGDNYGNGTYYIATAADEIYMNPGGNLDLEGLGGTTIFYKGVLDKLGVEVQVFKVGTYKSAVEPYILPTMSEPARAQLDTLYSGMWNIICEGIAEKREGLSAEKINYLIDNDFVMLQEGSKVLNEGLVDNLYYERSLDSLIAVSVDVDKEKIKFVSPSLLVSQEDFAMGYAAKNQIAVVYAAGEIIDGSGNSDIDYNRFVPIITELADDDNVKGMVLRVNSPGGSAFGSEQIGEALDYFQSKGKPYAVSMGDYAASGGYWISACANKIYADPLTVTGSIGIFGLVPNAQGLLNKIGLTTALVSTNPEAKFPLLTQPMTQKQKEAMQNWVEKGYDKFVARVAKGRKMSESRVRQIGEGRVWGAEKALEIGLVDQLGSLKDAIDWVASETNLNDYGVSYFPKPENSVMSFLPQIFNSQVQSKINESLGVDLSQNIYRKLELILTQNPVQARMPEFDLKIQ